MITVKISVITLNFFLRNHCILYALLKLVFFLARNFFFFKSLCLFVRNILFLLFLLHVSESKYQKWHKSSTELSAVWRKQKVSEIILKMIWIFIVSFFLKYEMNITENRDTFFCLRRTMGHWISWTNWWGMTKTLI